MITDQDWDQAFELLRAAETVAVCCHVSPDGDALGSMLGVGLFLQRLGKKVWMSWGSPTISVPPQYSFLPQLDQVGMFDEIPDGVDVFVAIDCGDRQRLDLLLPKFESAKVRLNIDHHVSNDRFGDVNLVDPDRASSAELAYELIVKMGGQPTSSEATCLYTGMVTDTGRFQYRNTTPETLRTAALLRERGVDHELIAEEVYESASFRYLHVLGIVLSRAELEGGLVWSWVDQDDLQGLGLDETEHFIDVLRAVRDAKLAVLLKQQPEGGYKASLRSRGEVDVSKLAKAFGGGGHSRAAGFSADGAAKDIISRIHQLVGDA